MIPQRIAQVTLSMGQGGIENLLVSLVANQNKDKYQTYIYCLDSGGDLISNIESLGATIRIFNRSPGLDLKLIFHLATKFKKDKIDIVHTHNEAAHFYGCLAARLARVAVVVNTEHSRHYLEGHWRRCLEKKVLSFLTNRIVAVSDELRQASISSDKISSSRLSVIVNGVDLDHFSSITALEKQILRVKLNFQVDEKIIVIVARLNPIKNHQLLIQALAHLSAQQSNLRLLIVGDGELRTELQHLVDKLNLSSKVDFLGNRTDVPNLLKMSDVLVLCSHREGLPLVLLEGMAAQIPVVVTTGANKSLIVEHQISGFVCNATKIDLADKIQLALFEPNIEEIVKTGRKLVEKKYSIHKTVDAYETLYQQMLTTDTADV